MDKEVINQTLELLTNSWHLTLDGIFESNSPQEWYKGAPNSVARLLLLSAMYNFQKDDAFITAFLHDWAKDENIVKQDMWAIGLHKSTSPILDKVLDSINAYVKKTVENSPVKKHRYIHSSLIHKHFKFFVEQQLEKTGMKWNSPYLMLDNENMIIDSMQDNGIRRSLNRHLYWDEFEELSKQWVQQPNDIELNNAWRENVKFWNYMIHHTGSINSFESVASYATERMTRTLTWLKPAMNGENLRTFVYSWDPHNINPSFARIYAKLPHPYAISLYVALAEYKNQLLNKPGPKRELSKDVLHVLIKARYMRIEKLKNNGSEKESISMDIWLANQLYKSRNAQMPKWNNKTLGYNPNWIPKDNALKDQWLNILKIARDLEQPAFLLEGILDHGNIQTPELLGLEDMEP